MRGARELASPGGGQKEGAVSRGPGALVSLPAGGTAFDERSFQPNAPVAVVNESFTEKFFGSQDPLSHGVSKI